MLARRRRFDLCQLPNLPTEVWLLIFRLATEVPYALLPRTESPFDLPCRPTYKEMRTELSRSLITKRYMVLVCKAWNEAATPLLYSAILLRTTRGVSAAWETFRDSAQRNGSTRLGHYVKRIDVSMRDSRIHHLPLKKEAEREEREKIVDILRRLPSLTIFVMHTRVRSGNANCIADALVETCASTLQTIEWTARHRFGHRCLSWRRLVSSCPNLKSLEVPGHRIFSTELHPTACLSYLSITYGGEVGSVPPNPPAPLHIRYSPANWDSTYSKIPTFCLRAISLDVRFLDHESLRELLAQYQCPKLSQLILRFSTWCSLPWGLKLDSSITHLGLFVEQKQSKLPLIVEGLGYYLVSWDFPAVKTLRLMSRHPLLEGANLKKGKIRKALQKIQAAGLVVENWEGKPLN